MLFQDFDQGIADLIGNRSDTDTQFFQSCDLVSGGTAFAIDDRSGMSHAFTRRGADPTDEGDQRFLHMFLCPGAGKLFILRTDLANQHDRISLFILIKCFQDIQKVRSFDRIPADTDSRTLPDPFFR